MSFPVYPSYRESGVNWLGALPGHWQVAPYKWLIEIQNGADHKHVEQPEGYPVIGSGGPFTFASDFLYDGESVLLGRKGTIDKPLHVTGRFWTVDTMYWSKIRPGISGRFAYYTATTIPFRYYSTNTALPSMTQSALSAHAVALPPLPEQTAIASFLDRETAKIDALVEEQRRLIELLKEKRQAVISHAVTKGLDPTAPMKHSGVEWLGDVPEHWDVRPLKRDLEYLTSGSRGWAEHYSDEGALFIRISNLTRHSYGLDLSDIQRVAVPEGAEGARTSVRAGDLLFSITAFLGSVAIAPDLGEPAYVSQHVALARLTNEHLRAEWVALVTLSSLGKCYFAEQGYGGTKIQLSLSDVGGILLTVPPIHEQDKIIQCVREQLDTFDRLTREADAAILLLRERRTALISAAVTGKIDVSSVAAQQAQAA